MNPILPKKYYIPDVEARQWNNGRMYLYGSNDWPGERYYCSDIYRVFSSDDLCVWRNEGISFTGREEGENHAAEPGILYAPDCMYIDGKYYLFYCQSKGEEGIAVSDYPQGPFCGAKPIKYADRTQIDPAVFVDDDGTVYYYWGQVSAKAGILDIEKRAIKKETIIDGILTEKEHGFHEGISMRKRNGIYYLVYTDISRGRATSIGYATSLSPLGPFKKQGIIIDNTGCDPGSWNNHGSIAEFRGQWYVFYHRSTHNSEFSRRVCVEPIYFDENGLIREVEMTTQGIHGPIKASVCMDAANACLLHGGIYIDSDGKEETFYEYLGHIKSGDWAAYKYLQFDGRETALVIRCRKGKNCKVFVRLDNPEGQLIAQGNLRTGKNCMKLIKQVSGRHALYLCFDGTEEDLQIVDLQFAVG
ncbi:family 43 glycosylhydrolase [Marvinbryantia formatexigens]|nr:family 43 glycosylhydrolase [Marvinbryantia formatexigens]UWO23763.1 family 43 glycosylhydrolase [Marvinbryantia formatexigens DSM 14469]SDF69897.1 Carbohydrate binding module (family 6) [Marvinbryantia formatexigens]